MGLVSVDGLLHRIQIQSPSTPTPSDLYTDGCSPQTLRTILSLAYAALQGSRFAFATVLI